MGACMLSIVGRQCMLINGSRKVAIHDSNQIKMLLVSLRAEPSYNKRAEKVIKHMTLALQHASKSMLASC